jgi:hypothetical protein
MASTNQETVQCVICLDPEIHRDLVISHPCGNDPICPDCFRNYFQSKIDGAAHGSCPPLSCPVCPRQPLLPFDLWFAECGFLIDKYNSLAQSLLSLQCGNCHARRTLMVSFESNSDSTLTTLQSLAPDLNLETLQESLSLFSLGKITINSFYQLISEEYFPSLSHITDQESWILVKAILALIPNPERRANLHLRYLRLRPRAAFLTCCSRSQCWRCKTRDTHEGRSCDEMEAQYDNGFVRCSQCLVYLVKGDGCDSVTCVCGKQFSWSAEREKFNSSRVFQDLFPNNTAVMYARVVCQANGAALCQPEVAESWAIEHELDAIHALRNWWRDTYAPYQSQCTLLKRVIPPTKGASKACLYWEQTHRTEIQKCREARDYAIHSLLSTYFPGYSPNALIDLFDRDDSLAKATQDAMTSCLPLIDRSFLQESIENFRIRSHQRTPEEEQEGTSNLFRAGYSLTRTVTEATLLNCLHGAQQFLALYGHLHAELGHLEIKLVPSEESSSQQRNGNKKKQTQKKGCSMKEMNRVLGSGSVLCRWSSSKSSRHSHRPYYPGVVTHYRKGIFDVDFTDGAGVHHRLGGLIFRYTLDTESSLYLPKFRCCYDSGAPSPAAWMPFFFPAIPMNQEHSRLYERYCSCLRSASQIASHPWVQEELLHLKDRTRIIRGIIPLTRLLDDTVFEADYSSPKQSKWQDIERTREETRQRKKEKRKQIEDCRRTEKVTWRDVFRGVMWKATCRPVDRGVSRDPL